MKQLDFRRAKRVEGGMFIPYRAKVIPKPKSKEAQRILDAKIDQAKQTVKNCCDVLNIDNELLISSRKREYVNIKKAIFHTYKGQHIVEALAPALGVTSSVMTHYKKSVKFPEIQTIINKLEHDRITRG